MQNCYKNKVKYNIIIVFRIILKTQFKKNLKPVNSFKKQSSFYFPCVLLVRGLQFSHGNHQMTFSPYLYL